MNSSTIGIANQEPKKYSTQSAYARMDDNNVARQQKIVAAQESITHDPVARTHASSIGSVQCTPLSNITNTHTEVAGFRSTSYASTGQNLEQVNEGRKKRSGQSWYAGLTDEKRAEYLNKQRIARLKRKQASSNLNVEVTQNSSFSIGATSTSLTSTRSAHPPEQDVLVKKQQTAQSWYGRLSDECRAEYLNKQRMKRLDKKSASASGDVGVPQSLSPQASAVETSMGTDYGSTEHQLPEIVRDCNKRGRNGWYANLSDQRKEEHLRKLRISRKQKRAAALAVNVNEDDLGTTLLTFFLIHSVEYMSSYMNLHSTFCSYRSNGSAQSELTWVVDMQSGRLNLDEGGCDDWLHRNLTYIRQDRPTEHVVPTSFISGRNIEPIDCKGKGEEWRALGNVGRAPFFTEYDKLMDAYTQNKYKLYERFPALIYCLKKIMEVTRCEKTLYLLCFACPSVNKICFSSHLPAAVQPLRIQRLLQGLVTRESFPSSDLVNILYRSAQCYA